MNNATFLRLVRRCLPKDPAWLATWDTDHVYVTGPRDMGDPVFLFHSEDELREQYPILLDAIVTWERQRLTVTAALLSFVVETEYADADPGFPAPETAATPRTWYYYASHRPLRQRQDCLGQPTLFLPSPEKPMDLPMQSITSTYVVTQQPIDAEIVENYTLKLVARPWTSDEEQRVREQYALPGALSL